MTTSNARTPAADRLDPDQALRDTLHRVWGFSDFRPLQREAMHAILEKRDSVVVLPTGGGKSLCFQAPAVAENARLKPRAPGSHDDAARDAQDRERDPQDGGRDPQNGGRDPQDGARGFSR